MPKDQSIMSIPTNLNAAGRYLPNILTTVRIILIPLIIYSFYFQDIKFAGRVASLLFFLAGVTDFADGYLARKFKLQSNFGKMLDPIADKLLIVCTLMILVHFQKANIVPSLLILTREILVSGLREFLGTLKISMPVNNLSKTKTMIQMFALFLLILGDKGSTIEYTEQLGNIMLWLAAILTIITGFSYYKASIKYFMQE
jgi:CDP-diacylglycerol--glycerol-3-phosphate 3-phosphatidyltransferase